MQVSINITIDPIIKVWYENIVFNSGVIYHFQLAMVGVWVNKVNFVSTGVMKNQHLIHYWNLYHISEKRDVFLIAPVIFVVQ